MSVFFRLVPYHDLPASLTGAKQCPQGCQRVLQGDHFIRVRGVFKESRRNGFLCRPEFVVNAFRVEFDERIKHRVLPGVFELGVQGRFHSIRPFYLNSKFIRFHGQKAVARLGRTSGSLLHIRAKKSRDKRPISCHLLVKKL